MSLNRKQKNFLISNVAQRMSDVYGDTLICGDTDIDMAKAVVKRIGRYFDSTKVPEMTSDDFRKWKDKNSEER